MTLFPYLPTRPEWTNLPWDAARAEAARRGLDSSNLTFIGHDSTQFHFQVYGVAQFAIAKPCAEV